MSATGRSFAAETGYVRQVDDYFRTPSWCVRAILPRLGLRPGDRVLDPCCGDGAILDATRAWSNAGNLALMVSGIEIDAERASAVRERSVSPVHLRDALDRAPWPAADVILMNPPFKFAMEFAVRALSEVQPRGTVAMLLRLPWMASAGRASFHRSNPSDVDVLPRRPEFIASLSCGNGSRKPKKPKCGWSLMQEIDLPRPKVCPGCGGPVQCSTTDATDYGWYSWGEGRGGRWSILDVEPSK